ncbi:integrase, catalytic region, zinc finger, CCHC-type containing protein [Tanacetum coccineum]
MSTSKTYQQSLADAGSENRPPMLERGSYIPWASRFRRYLNRKRDNRKWLLKALDEGPYEFKEFIPEGSTIPGLQTAKDLEGDGLYCSLLMKMEVQVICETSERWMWGSIQNEVDSETRFTNEFDQFVAEPGEALQFEKLVNASRAKKLEKSHDPLALVAHTGSSSRKISSYLVNIQSKNSGNTGRNGRRAYVQKEVVEGMNALKETGNVQRTLRIQSEGILLNYLEAKLKKNVDLILKLGNSLQGMFMLGPKPLSVYDQQLKHGLGYPNPYTLKQAISKCPKLYVASSLGNLEIPLNVRDSEDTLEDAFKSQQKMTEKMNDPIVVANKQNCWTINYKKLNALYKDFVPQKELSVEQKYFPSSSIPSVKISVSKNMPSESPLIKELDKIKVCFEKLDIKEMKDVFESTESELDELEKQNDLLKDQLLEASLKQDVELCVLINHECVDKILNAELEKVKKKSFEIQEGLQARIKILEKDVQRCEKQSVDFQLKLQHEKEKQKWDSNSKNKTTIPLDYSWISKIEKLEDENLFDSVKKTRSQTQKEMDELIVHVSEKRYAYGAIRAENHNLLSTISELKTRLEKVEKEMTVTSRVRRPMSRDSHVAHSVLDNSKKAAKNVSVYVRKNKTFSTNSRTPKSLETTYVALKTRFSKKETQSKTLNTTSVVSKSKIDVESASKAKDKVSSLGHNLFSVGQFCDGDLEVAFSSNTCYVRNLEGDDLLTGGHDSNLYIISISDMVASSPICLMSKATSTKSCLNMERITFILLVKGGKSKKASHPPKLVPSDHSKLELLHMDLCGPMRVASINGKKYILVIIHTDNGTEFKNATLKAHYEKLGIMQQFSIARTPQQNGVVERRNRTLVEAARTMLIFSKFPEFLWAEAVATACFTQNRLTSSQLWLLNTTIEPELQQFNNHNSSAEQMNTPSKEDLDNLFGPMFEKYYEQKSSDTPIYSAAQPTQVHEDSPSTSSIIVDTHEAPPVVTTSDE